MAIYASLSVHPTLDSLSHHCIWQQVPRFFLSECSNLSSSGTQFHLSHVYNPQKCVSSAKPDSLLIQTGKMHFESSSLINGDIQSMLNDLP